MALVYEEPETVNKLWSSPGDNPLFTGILSGIQKCPVYFTSPSESDEDAQAYIWMDNTTIYLTFRGSSSLEDFLADANILSTQLFKGRSIFVHDGFLDQFKSIELQITTYLKNDPVAQTLSNILVSGHSLVCERNGTNFTWLDFVVPISRRW